MEIRTSKRRLPSLVSIEEKPSLRPPGPANRSITGIVLSCGIKFLFVTLTHSAWSHLQRGEGPQKMKRARKRISSTLPLG